jgi:uncharacterized membrane protein (Fun14 family)
MSAPVQEQTQQQQVNQQAPITTANAAAEAKAEDTIVDSIIAKIPIQKISFGVLIGAATGSTVKRWTKDVAYGVGVGFIFLQTLSHYGFISINWRLIKEKTEKALDANGDGKFDMDDVKLYVKKTFAFLKRGLPDSVGFSAGFFLGIKYL